jgi:hypothetical protein
LTPSLFEQSGARFRRGRTVAVATGFLAVLTAGYVVSFVLGGDVTPLQAITLRIGVMASAAGFVAYGGTALFKTSFESALSRATFTGAVVAAAIVANWALSISPMTSETVPTAPVEPRSLPTPGDQPAWPAGDDPSIVANPNVKTFSITPPIDAALHRLIPRPSRTVGGLDNPPPSPFFGENAAGLSVTFDKGTRLQVGDVVAYRVTTRRSGYLIIFDATPDGKLTQVFPNSRAELNGANFITADRPMLIPDYRNPYTGFAIRITEPRGVGFIIAVLRNRPIKNIYTPDIPKVFNSSDEAVDVIENIRVSLCCEGEPLSGDGFSSWSFTATEYAVK